MLRFIIFFTMFLFIETSMASSCGVFRVVKGKVTFQKKGRSKFKKARINKKVCAGDTIKSAVDSRAKVVMSGGNELNISPETELVIEKYVNNEETGDKKALINVIYGKIRSNVKQKYKDNNQSFYRVKTKSAVAGVRGTEFLMDFDASKNQSRIVTFEGNVAVGQFKNGSIVGVTNVGPGQFTSNKVGTKPHPARNVPKSELANYERETTIEISPNSGDSNNQQRVPSDDSDSSGDQGSKDSKKGPSGNNRTPASEGGNQNDFDDFIDSELAEVELEPGAGDIGISPDSMPKSPPIISTENLQRLPNFTTPNTVTDQLLNREANVNIIPCIAGTVGCN